VDGRTYGRTDIFPPLILLGRFLEVDPKKKKITKNEKPLSRASPVSIDREGSPVTLRDVPIHFVPNFLLNLKDIKQILNLASGHSQRCRSAASTRVYFIKVPYIMKPQLFRMYISQNNISVNKYRYAYVHVHRLRLLSTD